MSPVRLVEDDAPFASNMYDLSPAPMRKVGRNVSNQLLAVNTKPAVPIRTDALLDPGPATTPRFAPCCNVENEAEPLR